MRHVRYATGTRPSAVKLDRALTAARYTGPTIEWGFHGSNKRLQLEAMRAAGVPCPRDIAERAMNEPYPQVGRPDNHRAGYGFWLVHNAQEREQATRCGQLSATHFMEYIANAREFRVHIAFGKSIKLTEKLYVPTNSEGPLHGLAAQRFPHVRSHVNGWHQMAPQPNAHRVSLRTHAKAAVAALGLDFGAVDILMRETAPFPAGPFEVDFFVLEVNSAPALTDPNTDTLARYVSAFVNHANERQA